MKKITAILLIFLTTSCAALVDRIFPSFPDTNSFVNRFPQNGKGIVIFKLSSKYSQTIWCKASLKKELLEENCFDIKPSNYYQIMMLEPGWYEIRGYQKNTRRYNKNFKNPRFSNITKERATKPELAFQVLQEKISFVGRIDYKSSKIIQKNSQDQDFSEIKQALKDKNTKKLHEIFKGHKLESEILAEKYSDKNYLKNLLKLQSDFIKTKKHGIKLK